ncbi:hypothetical protein QE152_g33499 [Popillia japonica]|uniref:Peptidase A2 domain-containing protein n=1 Tax=Popillia japonica TaxID=7064 RepID=A0AAW1IWW8_POPJA
MFGGMPRGRSPPVGAALNTIEATETPAIKLLVHECINLALIDTGASRTLVRSKWITGPTTSIPAMQLRLAAGNQTIRTDQQGTLDARTTTGVHFQCPAIPVEDLQADIILGVSWLIEQQDVIDLTRGCIHIGREQRQTIHFCR